MKKTLSLLLIVALLLALCACGSSNSKNNMDHQFDPMMFEPTNPVKDEDVLLTVELTPENFSDYFESAVIILLDENGEPQTYTHTDVSVKYAYVMGLRSIQYEDYILLDDGDSVFSYELIYNDTKEVLQVGNSDLWRGLEFVTNEYNITFDTPHYLTDPSQYTMKLIDCSGTLTFVNAKCIDSVEVEDLNSTMWGYKEYRYQYNVNEGYWDITPYVSFGNLILGDYAF